MRKRVPVMLLALCACGVPEAPGGSSARVRAQFDAARSSARWHPWGAAEQGRLGMVFAAYQQNDAAAKLFDRARELDAAEFRWHYYAAVVHAAASGAGDQWQVCTGAGAYGRFGVATGGGAGGAAIGSGPACAG